MREILYKAKRIDNGEWVYGSYLYTFCEDKNCPIVGIQRILGIDGRNTNG